MQDKAQIHVRVTQEFKRAVNMFCVRKDSTEQSWVLESIQAALADQAPELWPVPSPGGTSTKGAHQQSLTVMQQPESTSQFFRSPRAGSPRRRAHSRPLGLSPSVARQGRSAVASGRRG